MNDAGDEEQVNTVGAAHERNRKQQIEEMRQVTSTYEGRAMIWQILTKCNVFGNSFRGEETHMTAFGEGQRAVGLFIIEELFTSNKNSFTIIQSEAIKRTERIEREAENEQRANADD